MHDQVMKCHWLYTVYCITLFSYTHLKFEKVLFAVIVGSISLGNAFPELQTFATALGSATAIFSILDRVSFSMLPI